MSAVFCLEQPPASNLTRHYDTNHFPFHLLPVCRRYKTIKEKKVLREASPSRCISLSYTFNSSDLLEVSRPLAAFLNECLFLPAGGSKGQNRFLPKKLRLKLKAADFTSHQTVSGEQTWWVFLLELLHISERGYDGRDGA